jgi:hypothetical protein
MTLSRVISGKFDNIQDSKGIRAVDQTVASTDLPESIIAPLTYSVDTGEKPVNETMEKGNLDRKYTGVFETHDMTVINGRPFRDTYSLETHGFEFVDHHTKMKSFYDEEEVRNVYYKEAEQLIKDVSGAARVVIFDHTVRHGNQDDREKKLLREPVHRVHNDYTEWSGPQRVRDILPDEAEELLKKRVAVIQIWRAINTPIESDPLAICEAASLAPADLIASERRYPDRVGETYQISHNPDHKWIYFPRMTRDEALVFKVYDSMKDGRARFTAHTSFPDPTSPADALPRESIEIRTLAFFD